MGLSTWLSGAAETPGRIGYQLLFALSLIIPVLTWLQFAFLHTTGKYQVLCLPSTTVCPQLFACLN